MADHAGETVAETTRRLQAESAGITPPAKKRGRPSVVFTIVLVAIIVGGVVIAGIAGAVSSLSGPDGPLADDWSRYPGTYSTDPREVLASRSKEEVLDDVYALQNEFRDRLRDDYGFIWIQDYPERIEPEDNGYGGESMFDSYWSADWLGVAASDDPAMRSKVIDLWEELTTEYGGEDFYISNDIYDDDPQSSTEQFGSPVRAEQALWEAANHDDSVHGVTMLVDVFDNTIPVDDDFNGYYQEKTVEIDANVTANIFVSFTVWADHLLPEDDEAEFMERVDPYFGRDKPDYRS